MHSTVLAVHVTLALLLTVMLGVQTAELSRLRRDAAGQRTPGLEVLVNVIPLVNVLVAASGGILLRQGSEVGAWVAAGIVSSISILATSIYTSRLLRRPGRLSRQANAGTAAVQWGAPAFTLAGAFLMAARPMDFAVAFAPVALAVVVTAAAYFRATSASPASA
ncbi:hypothetical protein ACWEV3_30220 [Saccharopolyspora sp. NPDC003752]